MIAAMAWPLLLQAAALPAPAAQAAPAPWTPVMRSDAAGNRSATSYARAADGLSRLVVRCDARSDGVKVVSIQFVPHPAFAATTDRPVSLAFDGGSPLGWNWEYPGGAAFVRVEAIVTNLAAGIAHARAIHVRAMSPDNNAIDMDFAGPASDAPIRQVLGACDYQLGVVPTHAPAPAPAATPGSGR